MAYFIGKMELGKINNLNKYVKAECWNEAADSISNSKYCTDNKKRCTRDVNYVKSCSQKVSPCPPPTAQNSEALPAK
jgi:hypothetical protein